MKNSTKLQRIAWNLFIKLKPKSVFIVGLALFLSSFVQAQQITISVKNKPLKEIISDIESQSDKNFVYNASKVDVAQKRTVEISTFSFEKVLKTVFEGTGISYKIQGAKVVLLPTLKESSSSSQPVQAEKKTVTGQITDEKTNESLVGVTVRIKGTTTGTITDLDGNFEIKASSADVLVFSFIGYNNSEITVGSQTRLNLTLKTNTTDLDEVVVVGYGTQVSKKLTSSISKVTAKNIESVPATSFDQSIAGQMPGVQVMQNSGAPGGDLSIQIRGTSSITSTNEPLYVIDGFPVSGGISSNLNPNDIESIEVLKDASAAAIYGSRGANGVILISTKKGGGEPVISLNTYYGVQRVAKQVNLMDAYQHAEFIKTARDNGWVDEDPQNNSPNDPNSVRGSSFIIPEHLFPYLAGEKGLTNTNWQDEIFRDAPISNVELSVAGKKEEFKYYLSANYHKKEGVIIGSDFERFSFRSNFEGGLSDKVKIGLNLAPSLGKHNLISEKSHKKDGVVLNALIAHPHFPAYNQDGSLAISEQMKTVPSGFALVENPVALATEIDNTYEEYRMLGGTYLEYLPITELKFRFFVGADYISGREFYFRPSHIGAYKQVAPTISEGHSFTERQLNLVNENTITYTKSFSESHNFELLAGFTAQKESYENNYVEATNFPNDEVRTINAGQVTGGSAIIEEWSLLSYLGRLNYDYKEKYLLSASIRRDGSSRFGENTKWGWFPSFSLGWRLVEESFIKNLDIFSDLKLRFSYGETGNFNIPNYGSVALLEPSNYVFSGTVSNGLSPSTAPNANLSWEKSEMTNSGVNMGFLSNRIQFSFDYYNSKTDGLLLEVPVPATSGYSYSLQNIGKVKNTGYEIQLTTKNNISDLTWNASINYSQNKNEVLELGPGQNQILSGTHITEIGKPIGSYYGYNVIGVFESEEKLDSYLHLSTSKVGSYIYEDINDDGEITDTDRKILGDFNPDFTLGFTSSIEYKNFDFNFILQWIKGVEIYNLTRAFTINAEGWGNGAVELYEGYYRSEDEPGNGYARPSVKPTDKLYEQSNMMIEDGSFVRIRNISLGYTLPKKWSGKYLKSVRFYVSTLNPFTWTKYSGYNPEVSSWGDSPLTPGMDYGAYPVEKSIIGGINVKF